MDAIPLYTSVYLVNAGSIGIDAPFHHLYEHGSASVFVAIGRVVKEPVVDERGEVVARSCVNLVHTLDERASDGFYFARTAEVFRRLVADPGLLADPSVTVDGLLAGWPPHRG
jgi:pyruvate/2-oxoglutarate dehydrogenase complex dihydrolipoamide acyltransferase (E2) component